MKIENQYNDIIDGLKEGRRVLLTFQEQDLKLLKDQWIQALSNANQKEIEKIICIIDHSQNFDNDYMDLLIQTMNLNFNELSVLALGTSHRHVILNRHRQGERIPMVFIRQLEEMLATDDPEVLEWVLRTIEALGKQSLFLKERVLQSKPGFLKRFQSKWKSSYELIQFMENNWNPNQK